MAIVLITPITSLIDIDQYEYIGGSGIKKCVVSLCINMPISSIISSHLLQMNNADMNESTNKYSY